MANDSKHRSMAPAITPPKTAAPGRHSGQAVLLVIVAAGIFLIAGLGLAIDAAQMYGHRQMAQNAADSAAQAAMLSIFNGTNSISTNPAKFDTSNFDCTAGTDARTPCVYAQKNGFGLDTSDTVSVTFNETSSVPGVSLSTVDPVNLVRVTIRRNVRVGLIRFVYAGATSAVAASALCALVSDNSPIPIIVTHPTMPDAFHINGGAGTGSTPLKICGGPARSVQVNSLSPTANGGSGNYTIDLSHAGPLDDPTNPCHDGTGADFAVFGGPTTFTKIDLGTKPGKYIPRASVILDPLATVPDPSLPGVAPAVTAIDPGVHGCPAPAGGKCAYFQPGAYDSTNHTTPAALPGGSVAGKPGITVKGSGGSGLIAVFKPGIYYIQNGGFNMDSNSGAVMANDSTDLVTADGMVVFNTGSAKDDIINFGSNAGSAPPGIILKGAPNDSIYKGILFFQDRSAVAHNGVGAWKGHSIQGGGTLSLTGTIYVNQVLSIMEGDSSHYQALNIQGNAGSTTTITGQIITSRLAVGGTAGITMTLDKNHHYIVRRIALIG
jgi:Flp pilus assembly protein TadG